ncbi:MAG TPA: hypothetical protein VKB81_20325 [Nitrospira sp.]|nr:hypothetical protein [Nitrospira sp.]
MEDGDDHRTIRAGVDVAVGGIRWHKHGVSSRDRSVITANDNRSRTFPAENDLVGNWMTVKAILLPWFETIDIAVEIVRLPYPLPYKSSRRELFKFIEGLLLHGLVSLLQIIALGDDYRQVTSSQ